jgi:hypothetical protein
MSGEHAKKEMETGDKPATSHGKASSEESRNKKKGKEKKDSSHKSHRSGDKKKKMRKVVYYETDTSSPSTSGSDAPSITSKRHERKKFSKIPLHYPRTSRHTCRCFGSNRTPGVAPQGVFRSRTVSTTVAKWFVPIARGTVDKVYRFGPLRDA